jgi:putative ABC transport system permease protein
MMRGAGARAAEERLREMADRNHEPHLIISGTEMMWSETFDLAMQALRANKVRAALTMLGVIIGSACIVLVVTVALAGQRYIIGQIEGVGANLIYAETVHTGPAQLAALSDEMSLADLDAVKQGIPQVVEVAGTRDINASVVVGGVEHPVNVVGVTSGFQKIRNLVVYRGRYFDQGDMDARSKVCLITQDLSDLAFPYQNPVGQDIRLGELTFTVIGVFRERVATFGQTEITRDSVIVPFPLIKYYVGTEYIRTFYAQADHAEDVPSVTAQVAEILRSRHRPEAGYRVQNLASILETARSISLALTIVLIVIALIALTISGIGIMNIMLVTVTERTREIGIRKAIGARRSQILWQFLMEAVMISGTGALIGIGIAVGVPLVVQTVLRLFPIPGEIRIPISWVSVILAFVVSTSTGIFFGYLPASRAAQLDPTESLHYE